MTATTAPRRNRRVEPGPDAVRAAETRRAYLAVAAGVLAAVVATRYVWPLAGVAMVLAAMGHRRGHWSGQLSVAVAIIVTWCSAVAMTA